MATKINTSEKSHLLHIATVTAGLLLIPLIGMMVSSEIDWSLMDFVVMGALIFFTGLLIDLALRKAGKYRGAAILGILVLFLWLWAELAVGVFTNWGS